MRMERSPSGWGRGLRDLPARVIDSALDQGEADLGGEVGGAHVLLLRVSERIAFPKNDPQQRRRHGR
jgi:hypothetical protein